MNLEKRIITCCVLLVSIDLTPNPVSKVSLFIVLMGYLCFIMFISKEL